ncbi:MAG TPA: ABC transporter ATP-binding protein [Acidimicrobiales bacterium]|jgi:ABC-type lipoprotein export system ATPase subunit|nr:ABC transporter ATP-binding protein [Acidimicrobiales bacterium]
MHPAAEGGGTSAGSSVPALELDGISKRYQQGGDDVVVLNDATLHMAPGEFVSLVGPSGSGKSTLLHIAGGLDKPDTGRVQVAGIDLSTLGAGPLAQVRRRHIGFVFQFFQLLPTLSVRENVELPLIFDGKTSHRVDELLERIGLAGKGDRLPGELSGGEMQRVAIARSLVAGAPLILADEPTGNLDAVNAAEVLDLLTEQVRLAGAALLLVTHDAAAASRADRVFTLTDGHLSAP